MYYTTFLSPNVGLSRWRLTSATSAKLTNHDCARSARRKWIITSIFTTFPTRNVGLVGDNWHRQHPPSLRIMIAREAQGKNYKLYATTRATKCFSAWRDDWLGHQKGSHRRGSEATEEATERGRLWEGDTPRLGLFKRIMFESCILRALLEEKNAHLNQCNLMNKICILTHLGAGFGSHTKQNCRILRLKQYNSLRYRYLIGQSHILSVQ